MRIAIITWASSWLWRAFINPLYRAPVDQIWLLARNKERLKELQEEYWDRIVPCAIDLSKKEGIDALVKKFKELWVEIAYLVNNAWFWLFWSNETIPLDKTLDMIDVNIKALVNLTTNCLPFMGKWSRIINIASLASFQPVPYMAAYAATKSFVKSYSRALNVELKDSYITVTAVCPWWMDTNFMNVANIWAKKSPKVYPHKVNPEFVAETALRDADKWKDISMYWWYSKMIRFLSAILPDKLLMKIRIKQQDL